ncbi:MAG: hypothetical protein ACHQ3P_01125 [Candidatus Limnocylindrales bacterium]
MSTAFLAASVAACGATTDTPPPNQPTPSAVESIEPTSPSEEPSVPASPAASPSSSTAGQTASTAPTSKPTPTATSAHGPDQGAAACFGSADTRDFFVAIAEAVTWPVYCAVLPSTWAVDLGVGRNTYALANGGRMVIGYHDNTGAHLELREGRWCTDSPTACAPSAQDLGDIAVGNLDGTIVDLGGSNGYAVYVAPGQSPSWTFTGSGLDEADFRSIIGALSLVGS